MNSDHKSLEALKEAGIFYRFQIALMFGQFTIYLASYGWLLKVIDDEAGLWEKLSISICGLFLSSVFFINSARSHDYMLQALSEINNYKKELRLTIYSKPPDTWLPRPSTSMKAVYLLGAIFWVVYGIKIILCISNKGG